MTERKFITNEDQFNSLIKEGAQAGKKQLSTYYKVTEMMKPSATLEDVLDYIRLEKKVLKTQIDRLESNSKEWIKICGTKKGYEMYLSNQKARWAAYDNVLFYARTSEVNYSDKL